VRVCGGQGRGDCKLLAIDLCDTGELKICVTQVS
jgi:hypothetical protein